MDWQEKALKLFRESHLNATHDTFSMRELQMLSRIEELQEDNAKKARAIERAIDALHDEFPASMPLAEQILRKAREGK